MSISKLKESSKTTNNIENLIGAIKNNKLDDFYKALKDCNNLNKETDDCELPLTTLADNFSNQDFDVQFIMLCQLLKNGASPFISTEDEINFFELLLSDKAPILSGMNFSTVLLEVFSYFHNEIKLAEQFLKEIMILGITNSKMEEEIKNLFVSFIYTPEESFHQFTQKFQDISKKITLKKNVEVSSKLRQLQLEGKFEESENLLLTNFPELLFKKNNDGQDPLTFRLASKFLDVDQYTSIHTTVPPLLSVVKRFIQAGAKVDNPDNLNKTGFMYSVENGYEDVIQYLAKLNAKIDQKDIMGNTIFHLLAQKGNIKVFEFLFTIQGNTLSNIKYQDQLFDLLKEKNNDGDNFLQVAKKFGNNEFINYVISSNVYQKLRNKPENLPFIKTNENIVENLQKEKNKAPIDLNEIKKETIIPPIFEAFLSKNAGHVCLGNLGLVKPEFRLISFIELACHPIMTYSESGKKQEMERILLNVLLNTPKLYLNISDEINKNPPIFFSIASNRNNIVNILLPYVNLCSENKYKENIFHIAAKTNNYEFLKDILEKKLNLENELDTTYDFEIADLLVKDNINNESPLQVAVRFNHKESEDLLTDFFKRLKDHVNKSLEKEEKRLKNETEQESNEQIDTSIENETKTKLRTKFK